MLVIGLLALPNAPEPPTPISLGSGIEEGVPRWVFDWVSKPGTPCRSDETGPHELETPSPTSEPDGPEPIDLAERSRTLEARGLRCAAVEDLLRLASELEETDIQAARETLNRALALALRTADSRLLARTAERLGSLEANEQNVRRALELSLAAGYLWEHVGDEEASLRSRYNLGVLLLWTGRFEDAEIVLNGVLSSALSSELESSSLVAATLTILGRVYIATGDLERAEAALRRARRVRPESDVRGIAATLDALSRLRIEQGRFVEAESLNREVLERVEGEARGEANALATRAEIRLGLGDAANARSLARRARTMAMEGAAEDPNLDLHSLFVQAEAERLLGNDLFADASMEALLARTEEYRRAGQGSLALPFFAARRRYVSRWIEELATHGRIEEAFEIAEWTRARELLDRLVTSPAEVRDAASSELIDREDELRSDLAAHADRLDALEASDAAAATVLGEKVRRLRLSAMAVEASMRQEASAVATTPIDFATARELAGQGTLILCYWLGETRSLLWVLDSDGARLVSDLPARRAIERSAVRLRRLLEKGKAADEEVRVELRVLSDALLRPVAAQLSDADSIVVVPDGALAEVPFAALLQPAFDGKGGEPLVELAPVTLVYSLSVLAKLEESAGARRSRQSLSFAGMGDPVYSPADPRLSARIPVNAHPPGRFRPRLRWSGNEVRAASRLFGSDSRWYVGLDASRARVLRGALDRSRYVHIGAHAELDTTDPYLSAIYLSAFDEEGRSVDGALRLQDVEAMTLAADVVFLAGCETGRGRTYLGEGPLALPRGFLSAGAGAVVASLWAVEDVPTSILVERFWEAVLLEGQAPARALRTAQLELIEGRKWSHPVHWAGFVLLGDGMP